MHAWSCIQQNWEEGTSHLCCSPTRPRWMICATSTLVGHSSLATQPNTPQASFKPASSVMSAMMQTLTPKCLAQSPKYRFGRTRVVHCRIYPPAGSKQLMGCVTLMWCWKWRKSWKIPTIFKLWLIICSAEYGPMNGNRSMSLVKEVEMHIEIVVPIFFFISVKVYFYFSDTSETSLFWTSPHWRQGCKLM